LFAKGEIKVSRLTKCSLDLKKIAAQTEHIYIFLVFYICTTGSDNTVVKEHLKRTQVRVETCCANKV
jgi:uncharacterized protein (DUF2249 family)